MKNNRFRIGVLTSSRADFGIYSPLVKNLMDEPVFEVEIIAFGTHLQKKYGHTIDEILNLGWEVKHTIFTCVENNSPKDISMTIGDTIVKFAQFWENTKFDLVFALGDRYEMFAAVTAASTFNIDIAHIHAGETTLGAIDNAYRHCISLMSKYLFVTTNVYKKRGIEIIKTPENVFNVGALSIDNLKEQQLLTKEAFKAKFGVDISKPSILVTFHPETVSLDKHETYISELITAFEELEKKYQIIITMPNSDTLGDMIREKLIDFAATNSEIKLIESFGMQGYLTCMKYCKMLVGNTSSGFVEAAFFPKWVINLGDRQKGRILTKNIISTKISKNEILEAVKFVENSALPKNTNIYGNGNAATKISNIIKEIYGLS